MEFGFGNSIETKVASQDFDLERRIFLAQQMNVLSNEGRWDEALDLACSDDKVSMATKILGKNLREFENKGESLINARFIQEARELGDVNFDLAIDVEQGEISREATLIIAKLYGSTISEDQIYTIARAFVARENGEELTSFNERRVREINSLRLVEGLSEKQVDDMKNEIIAVLRIYNNLEDQAVKNLDAWPIRTDGQKRRSFIDRSRLLDLAIETVRDVQYAHIDLEGAKKKILENSQIPDKIESHEDILKISGLGERIKCVSFDMFDTLVEWTSNVNERHELMIESALAILQKYNISIDRKYFSEIREEIWYKKYKEPLYPMREFNAEVAIADIVERICQEKQCHINQQEKTNIINEINEGFISVDSDTAISTPGILNTLRELKEKKVKVVVVSNHPYDRSSIVTLLEKYGLNEYIDEIIISSEVGYRKTKLDPNATIFKHMLGKMGMNSDQVVHIGDNADNDFDAPKAANIKGVRFENPESTQRKIEYKRLDINSEEYKSACIENLTAYMDRSSSEYYARVRDFNTPRELEKFALRVYNMSRDYYAPLLIKFSEYCLDKLKRDKNSLNLCVGRDALAIYLIQQKMAKSFPDRYGQEVRDQIKYVPLSRTTTLASDPNTLKKYLSDFGIDNKSNINIVDNGIEGTIQNHLTTLYPHKNFEGEYLQAGIMDDDPNKNKKHGFIYEFIGQREYDANRNIVGRNMRSIRGKASASDLGVFVSADFIHCQEDIWNGIFSSAGVLIENVDGIYPINKREKMDFVAGNPDVIPGLNSMENYLLLKKMALKGIMDGLKIYKRQCQLNMQPSAEETVINMSKWFKQANAHEGLDKKIFDGMARKRN